MQIDILFEDKTLLVVNKPSGLLTQASVDKKRPDLYSMLLKDHEYLALHHRLDVGTSGVVLFCKDKNFNKDIQNQFKEHLVQKTYRAVCYKVDKKTWPDEWLVENYLGLKTNSKTKQMFTSVKSGGDYAKTVFRKIDELENKIYVEARPLTGRTHQIRVHLYEKRLPILGDTIYKRKDVPEHDRLMLHAFKLKILHPLTNEEMTFEADLPQGFSL